MGCIVYTVRVLCRYRTWSKHRVHTSTVVQYTHIYLHIYYCYHIGIVTVLVGNTRKAVTIILSFLLFPKPGSILYLLGGIFVFGSLIGNAIMKERLLYSGGAGGGGAGVGGGKGKGDLTKNMSFGGV